MSPHEITAQTAIVAFKTVSLLLGGLITYLAYKAYRRTELRSLLALAVGFGIVTVGTFLAGVADQVIAAGFQFGLLIESVLITLGFGVIVYSLYVTPE